MLDVLMLGILARKPSSTTENYSQRIQKMKLQNKILFDFLSFLMGVILIALAFAKVW